MVNKNLIYTLIGIAGIIVSIFVVIVYKNTKVCDLENCHGLNVDCGFIDANRACTMMYMAGDNCRQFVNCRIIGSACRLEKSSKFEICKSCVEKCEQGFQEDQIEFFQCESKCAN